MPLLPPVISATLPSSDADICIDLPLGGDDTGSVNRRLAIADCRARVNGGTRLGNAGDQNRQRIEPGVCSAVPTAVAVRGVTS